MDEYIQLKNKQVFIQELKDKTKIDIKDIYQLYKNEFINTCESILIENQYDFLDNFYNKMDLIIKNIYGENIFEIDESLYLTKKQCENNFVTEIYYPMYNLCSSALKKFFSKTKFKNFLVNFRPHCIYDQVPLHSCGSKFIQIFDDNHNENNTNTILYVVCTGCSKCYYTNCIRMNCHYCQIDFYSEIVNYPNNLYPATWKNYHCNNDNTLINEQMHCIICKKTLFIKNNKLFCNNCQKFFDSDIIIWTCKICNKDFKSDIKIFNPLEFKEIELAKRDAFLYKKVSKPNYLPCNCICKNEIDKFDFVHELNGKCKGLLYYSYINEKEFLVCSCCKSIYDLDKYFWNCPICGKNFITNELRFYEYFKRNNMFRKTIKDNFIYPKIKKKELGRKINNSNSQKIISDKINDKYKVYQKNNSYIKKRINSSHNSNNNSINNSANSSREIFEDNKGNSLYRNKNRKALSILLNNNNISKNNNNSNKESNSISNKYNVNSTTNSSNLNNNNFKQPQTITRITESYISKKDRISFENRINNSKYIEEKKLNIPLTTMNKNKYENENKRLYTNRPYKSIEEYINNFNYNEKNNNKNNCLNTSIKTDYGNDNNKNEEEGNINNIKKCFKKFQKNNYYHRDNSFINISNKSLFSQKTDMKFNQIYIPKKHIHKSSAPATPLYKDMKNNYSNLNNNNDQRNNNYLRYEYNYRNNHSCERRSMNNLMVNENSIHKNIQKLRELSGPKIYPIIKKNIIIGNNSKNKYNSKTALVQQNTNLNNIDKKKSFNNQRNYTNIYPNQIQNNKISTTINEEKNKFQNKMRNNNFQYKNSKKNNCMNRNSNYNTEFNYKNKSIIITKEKYNTNILNNSIDDINNNNIQNNFNNKLNNNLKKNYITNNQQNIHNKRKDKRDNNINNNDGLFVRSLNMVNKNNQSGKIIKNKCNYKKAEINEFNSNSKTGTLTKNNNNKINNNLNSTNKKNNIKKNKISKIKVEKEKPKEKEKENELNINNKENNNSYSYINEKEEEDELKTFNFDEYKIITQLGQGSFGKIYLVQNSQNELFTMKKLVYSEELDVQSVIKEYKMCYKLKHQNVVKILGIYSNKLDKTTYVVYVLMEVGMTDWEKEIKTHIEKKIPYKESELIQIIKQLIEVLSFLQKQNISHRDIKPQNILVFKNNVYKLADFGEAKQIENMTINLASNSLRGTELYMSPLLFNGLRTGQVDIKHNIFKSDVYSFGLCILFAGTLEIMSLYDIRKYVEMSDVKKYLNKMFKNKYSDKFIDLLFMLLEIHENKRPDFIDLERIIKEWRI